MSVYANQIPANGYFLISVNEVRPLTIEFVPLTGTNSVVSLTRFDLNNTADTGTAVTGSATITGDLATVKSIWNVAETPAAGYYRLRLICADASGAPQREVNLIYVVVA